MTEKLPLTQGQVAARAAGVFFGVFFAGIILGIALIEWALRELTP